MKTFADFGIDIAGKSGVEVKVPCPKCSPTRKKDKYPCLNVNTEKEAWNCWHCNRSGSLRTGWSDDRETQTYLSPQKQYRKPDHTPQSPRERTLQFFAKRGIPAQVVIRRQIDVGPIYMPQVEEEVEAIRFPYFRDGVCVNIKYRDSKKNFRMESGAERILYGYDDIHGDSLIWTEGEMDALSVEVAGYTSCVSVPDGAPAPGTKNYGSKFDFLDSAMDKLNTIQKHIIAVDMDAPGQTLAEELARRLGPEKCMRVTWTQGCKDANEVLVQHGAQEVQRCIDEATPWPVAGIITVQMLMNQLDAMYDHGVKSGASTGWTDIEDYYRVQTSELTIVSGIPSHGKTRWLSHLLINMATIHGWKFAVFSPEASPQDFVRQLIEQYTGKSFYASTHQRMTQPEMWEAAEWVGGHFSILLPENGNPTVDQMLNLARIQVSRMGIRGVVFDPWSWFGKPVGKGQLLAHYAGEQLVAMKSFAIKYDLAFWLVAHPTKLRKMQAGEYAGLYPPPTLYDISDSSMFYNNTDNGICVWRNTETKSRETLIQIQKIRNEYSGQLGDVTLIYDPYTKRYYDRGLEPDYNAQSEPRSHGTQDGPRITPDMTTTII